MTAFARHARAWLVLSRLSNLPTIWTNALAAGLLAGASVDERLAAAAAAVSLMYVGGMILNDVCDAAHDRLHRPTRPIPAGDISTAGATVAAGGLMLAGMLIAVAREPRGDALAWAGGLVIAVVYYDLRHKRDPLAPVVMGVCRGLTYGVAAVMAAGSVPWQVLAAAGALTLYVAAFTLAARHIPAFRPAVSWCIAAISLVDAGALAAVGAHRAAAVAAAGMPLTLLLQRWVPGD